MPAPAIKVLHPERIPKTGALVIPSRLDLAEARALEALFHGRQVTWLIEESSRHQPDLRSYLESSGSGAMFTAGDSAPAVAGKQLAPYTENGGVLIFVPGLANARSSTLCHIPGPQLETLTTFGLAVLPVAVDHPRDSALSIGNPEALPTATVSVGHGIAAGQATPAAYLESLLNASADAFSTRQGLDLSLAAALLKGLKKHGSSNHVHDGADDASLKFSEVLAAALALSRYIREETDKPRVAIVLPPGKAGLIANLAVVFAGKVPVNLNFTAGPEAIRSCIRQSGVDRFITADPFVRRVSSFPWPPNRDLIFIERTLPALKKQAAKWAILAKLLPTNVLASILGANKASGDDEAALLFTSGSSGEPKGVSLSHRNILSNIIQFNSRLQLPHGASILGSLPLFHSFGFTVTLWYPLIQGLNLITYPSAIESKRLAELIAQHQIELFISTPTFLRGHMKRVDPVLLASLRMLVTGAEKLPQSLADAFEDKFGIRPLEGYGLTETSPVTNVNLPDPAPEPHPITIPASRKGSVGQLMPGLALRITDPSTGKSIPIDRQGIIWFKGPNVFAGYLGLPEVTKDVIQDGWFRTGDVGYLDADGFLHIEGRISRFSKIGGEMVPHETLEAAINKVLGLDSETERRIAVVGMPDEQKGEAIALLSTISGPAIEQECIDLRYKLLDDGIPSLWCPKQIIPVAEIPVLASGKLDIKACQDIATSLR